VIQRTVIVAAIVISAAAATAAAQGDGIRVVENPFQDDFEYRVDTDLKPQVEIAGVQWTRFGIHIRGDREFDSSKSIPVTVELDFNNTNPDGVKVLVIILFEDANGNPIDRLECDRVSVSGERAEESADKYKVSGAVLRATGRVYLFCEVDR
jgi:hypothetical protein